MNSEYNKIPKMSSHTHTHTDKTKRDTIQCDGMCSAYQVLSNHSINWMTIVTKHLLHFI